MQCGNPDCPCWIGPPQAVRLDVSFVGKPDRREEYRVVQPYGRDVGRESATLSEHMTAAEALAEIDRRADSPHGRGVRRDHTRGARCRQTRHTSARHAVTARSAARPPDRLSRPRATLPRVEPAPATQPVQHFVCVFALTDVSIGRSHGVPCAALAALEQIPSSSLGVSVMSRSSRGRWTAEVTQASGIDE